MTTNSEKTLLSRFSRGTFADEDDMNRSHGLGQTSSRFPWMTNSTKESFIKISTVVAVIVIALMFLSPFIVHIVQIFRPTSTSTCFEAKPVSHECEDLSWSSSDNNRTCSEYNGTVCRDFLHEWRNCIHNVANFTDNRVFVQISLPGQQKAIEDEIFELFQTLRIIGSTACTTAVIPFICQSAFPLCNQSGIVFKATKEECQYVSMQVCALEWQYAADHEVSLPDCDSLPDQEFPINTTRIRPENGSNLLSCNQQFFENNGTCVPNCYTFKQTSDHTSFVVRIFEIGTGWFALCMCVIVFMISVKRYKAILTFPTIILVYMTTSIMVIALLVVITFFDQGGLYCTSKDLNYTLSHPTTFCTLSGALFHYFLINGTLWWFFHVSFLFYMLIFPMKAKLSRKYDKYIHVVLFTLGVLLPLPGVISIFAYSEYTVGEFPALLCVPKNGQLWYYSTILPLNVLLGVGVCMFPPMIWVIHKHQAKKRSGKILQSAAERRILLVLCFYAVFGISSLLYFGVTSWDQNTFLNYLIEYFECEGFGKNDCQHCYQKYTNPILKIISFVMMSIIPAANLVFVTNWKYIGTKINFYKFTRGKEMQDEHSILTPETED